MFSKNNDSPRRGQGKSTLMPEPFQRRCYQLAKAEIGYLRFITEAYDGLLWVRTLDPGAGLVEIAWPASRETDVASLLAALGAEIGLVAAPDPPVGLYPGF